MADRQIYLDYAATAPLCEEARDAMQPYVSLFGNDSLEFRGNANSLYTLGRDAHNQMEAARRSFSKVIGAKRPEEVIFTSSSTESIFIALAGLFNANNCKTIITSSIEHPAVLEAAHFVAGKNNVFELKVNKWGFVSADDLADAIKNKEAPLVSIQMANSELASVQNLSELAKVAHDAGCLFHTDATQALGKVKFKTAELGIDSASFSSHKIGGPQGVGALYLKNSLKFSSPIVGGGQESKRRGGTQNVCGIVGFAAAAQAVENHLENELERLAKIKSKLAVSLSSLTTSANKNVRLVVNEEECISAGSGCSFLPNIATFIVGGIESETAILRLDDRGISVAGGSACSSGSTTASRALKAVGIPDDDAFCELRISFGRYTTGNDIETFINEFKEVI